MRMAAVVAGIAALLLSHSGYAIDDQHGHPQAGTISSMVSPHDPPIRITINPEARVSVALAGALPPPAACGTPAILVVQIVNQGFVTARLEAELVDNPPRGVTLTFAPEPLSGKPKELRDLRITLTKPGLTDLTIAFKAHNDIPDLGGRDRIHFLMHCR